MSPSTASPVWREPWSRAVGGERAVARFIETFDREPDGVWSAPGRVNLIGEHTDYNGGLCLPTALPHRTYVAFGARPPGPRGTSAAGATGAAPGADEIRLVSGQRTDVWTTHLADVGPGTVEGWGAYPAGVAWALRERATAPTGFDAAVDSCVPFGAGLSSSAALESAVAVALDDAWDLGLGTGGRAVLARACMRAENEIAGAPTGGLDQSASLLCAPGQALLLDFRPGVADDAFARPVPFDLAALGLTLLVIDTRAEHSNADGQYAQRRSTCEDAARTLGVETLRDVDPDRLDDALASLDDDVSRRRVRHVVTEVARVRQFVEVAATATDAQADPGAAATVGRRLGELLDASHASLRDDYEVSCVELDDAVEAARAAGAVGARMTGGGFGGSAIALVPRGTEHDVADAVAQSFASRGFAAPAFLPGDPSDPAGRDT